MMTWRYVLSGDAAAAQAAMREVLQQHGFAIEEESNGEWRATQGARPSFLARMAGDVNEPVILRVRFAAESDGVEVELHRPMLGTSGMSGDVRLMAHMDDAYRANAHAMHEALAAKGILLRSQE